MTTTARRDREGGDRARRITYALFALAALSAGLAIWLDEGGTRFAPVFAMFLGLALLVQAFAGHQAGRIRVRRRTAERDEQPITFWTTVVLLSAAGLVLSMAGVLLALGVL